MRWRTGNRSQVLLIAALASLELNGCGSSSSEPELPEYLGRWELVRIGGQSLPVRIGGSELRAESVTFIAGGGGNLTDDRYSIATLTDSSATPIGCSGFISHTLIDGQIRISAFGSTPLCLPLERSRVYRLDGDTLRLVSAEAIVFSEMPRAYVRAAD